jgi:hypothetical protein
MSRRERNFFMVLTALGALFTAFTWVLAAVSGHWILYPGGGIGLVAFGGGLFRLRLLSTDRNSKPHRRPPDVSPKRSV